MPWFFYVVFAFDNIFRTMVLSGEQWRKEKARILQERKSTIGRYDSNGRKMSNYVGRIDVDAKTQPMNAAPITTPITTPISSSPKEVHAEEHTSFALAEAFQIAQTRCVKRSK